MDDVPSIAASDNDKECYRNRRAVSIEDRKTEP
jgi:hypothetical protein